MQRSRIVVTFAVVMLTATLALAQKVTTDYRKTADFAAYKTYTWIKEPTTSDPLMRQRIIDDVNRALAAKGLRLTTGQADLGVAAHTATKERRTLNTFYDGFGGGWRWGGGFGGATTTVDTFEVGTLVVDVFDGQSKEALWRGTSTKTISDNPQKNATNLNKAVEKMFEKFPPSNRKNTEE
jgi:hypothetical protein